MFTIFYNITLFFRTCFEEGALCALYLVMFLVLENFLSKICLSNKKLRISTHSLGYSRSLVLNLDIRLSMTIFTSKLFFFSLSPPKMFIDTRNLQIS